MVYIQYQITLDNFIREYVSQSFKGPFLLWANKIIFAYVQTYKSVCSWDPNWVTDWVKFQTQLTFVSFASNCQLLRSISLMLIWDRQLWFRATDEVPYGCNKCVWISDGNQVFSWGQKLLFLIDHYRNYSKEMEYFFLEYNVSEEVHFYAICKC